MKPWTCDEHVQPRTPSRFSPDAEAVMAHCIARAVINLPVRLELGLRHACAVGSKKYGDFIG
jgi:hypothetical protein